MTRLPTVAEFEALYRSTAPSLLGYLRRRGVPDAEDLTAEVYATAWRRRSDLPPPMLRRAWLFGVARNLVLAEARRAGRERETVELVALTTDVALGEVDVELHDRVAAALSRLRPHDRELVLLVEWEGLSPAEVAVVLGIRPGAARVRLHRARQALAADADLATVVEARTGPVTTAERRPGGLGS